MKCTTIISAVAFAVIFLSALFLFMRNYPSDRWFSVVFIVAGGVSLWCVWGAGAGDCTGIRTTAMEAEAVTETAETEVLDAVTEATETVPVETITS
jgi:hypothetical protein